MTTLDVYGHLWPDRDESTLAAVEAVLADRAEQERTGAEQRGCTVMADRVSGPALASLAREFTRPCLRIRLAGTARVGSGQAAFGGPRDQMS